MFISKGHIAPALCRVQPLRYENFSSNLTLHKSTHHEKDHPFYSLPSFWLNVH